ncbi:MAG: response regulator transcription factor [Lachnospira sp.]|nr:response regulator transcription factor [Lachnospira sp.]
MRIAVCDDEPIYVERISSLVKDECIKRTLECEIDTFYSGEALLNDLKNNEYDLVLLDIRMPDVNGFEVASEVYKMTKGDNLVFVSNEEHLVCSSMEFRPFGFVRKRILAEEIENVFSRWYQNYEKNKVISFTYGRDKEQMHLRVDDIMYVEAAGHYVTFHAKDNMYDMRAHISEMEHIFDDKEFVKCSRSFICNLRYVMSKKNDCFIMRDGRKITIGRNYRESVWEKYNEYLKCEYLGE